MKTNKNKSNNRDPDSYVLNTAGAVMPDPKAKFQGDSKRDIQATFGKEKSLKPAEKKSSK